MYEENCVDSRGELLLEKVTDALMNNREKLGLSKSPPDSRITEKYNGRSVAKAFEDGAKLYSYFRKEALLGNCLNENSLMLDFGCGWGRFSQLARIDLKPENIFSADISAEALDLSAQQGLRRENLIKLSSGSSFPIESNMFDLVIVNSVFSHLSERSASFYIQELHRVLKSGGMLLLTVRSASWMKYILKLVQMRKNGEDIPKITIPLVEAFGNQLGKFDENDSKFIFVTVGNELGGDYGEAYVPDSYIVNKWGKNFHKVKIAKAETLGFDQSVVSLVK